jgi:hypothetical protein
MGRRNKRSEPEAARPAPVARPPQPRLWQLIASSALFGLWLIFLLAMALTA